jgi:hypothetical protein
MPTRRGTTSFSQLKFGIGVFSRDVVSPLADRFAHRPGRER